MMISPAGGSLAERLTGFIAVNILEVDSPEATVRQGNVYDPHSAMGEHLLRAV